MAIDDASKRASVLHVGSFFPGRIPQSKDRDAGDLDDANQRGFVLWHYAGIAAGALVPVVGILKVRYPSMEFSMGRRFSGRKFP